MHKRSLSSIFFFLVEKDNNSLNKGLFGRKSIYCKLSASTHPRLLHQKTALFSLELDSNEPLLSNHTLQRGLRVFNHTVSGLSHSFPNHFLLIQSQSLHLFLSLFVNLNFIFREKQTDRRKLSTEACISITRWMNFPAMCDSRARTLFLLLLHSVLLALVSAQGSKWPTLSGTCSALSVCGFFFFFFFIFIFFFVSEYRKVSVIEILFFFFFIV